MVPIPICMRGKCILIVEDEEATAFMLASRLRDHGYTVETAGDGREALSTALRAIPDLVITDFQLPGMNGLELAAALRAEGATAGVPIIMLTGRGHKVSTEVLGATNIRQMMSKPFSAKEIVASVSLILTGSKGTAERGAAPPNGQPNIAA